MNSFFSITEDCNEIELELEYINNEKNIDKEIFGKYVISSEIHDNREVYLSENGTFQIWYEAEKYRWAISRKTGGKQNPLMYLNVIVPYYGKTETFTYNAKGTKSWTVVDGQLSIRFYVHVSVKCSPMTGKISNHMIQAKNLILKIFLLLSSRLET